jgi:hypothetical protein
MDTKGSRMSFSYHMTVEVENLPGERHEAVIAAVAAEWDYNTDYPEPEACTLRFTGYEDLAVSAPVSAFPEHIALTVWRANGGFCPVRVRAVHEEGGGAEDVEFSEQDYVRLSAGVGGPPAGTALEPACPDCGALPGAIHGRDCNIERCSVCGDQRVGCGCEGHDPTASAWIGEHPVTGGCPLCALEWAVRNVRMVPETDLRPDPGLAARPPGSYVGRNIKKSFPTGDPAIPVEHMWVRVRAVEGGALVGALNSIPVFSSHLRLGDPVQVAMGEIEGVQPGFD